MDTSRYRIVVVDCPIDVWQEPRIEHLFHQIIDVKLQGYGAEYPYGVIAVDGTDFVATHIAVCEEKGGRFEPLLAYKSISLERCLNFKQTFPALALARAAKSFGHVRVLTDLVKRYEQAPSRLRYCSAFTIRPELRKDRELTGFLKNLLAGVHVNLIKDTGAIEALTCGVVRFRVDKLWESWGYHALSAGEQPLPSIRQVSLDGEEVKMYRLVSARFSEHAERCAEEYAAFWQNRVVIDTPAPRERIKIAA
jgi:hypothetical protein